jgi:hypothetical protein
MVVKKVHHFKVEIETKAYKAGGGAAITIPREFVGHLLRATLEIID